MRAVTVAKGCLPARLAGQPAVGAKGQVETQRTTVELRMETVHFEGSPDLDPQTAIVDGEIGAIEEMLSVRVYG